MAMHATITFDSNGDKQHTIIRIKDLIRILESELETKIEFHQKKLFHSCLLFPNVISKYSKRQVFVNLSPIMKYSSVPGNVSHMKSRCFCFLLGLIY